MEEGRRSGEPSGYVVKNRNSSGCLIVRKKGVGGGGGGGGDGVGGGVGSSGAHKLFDSRKEKKRHRVEFSDSGSSDEIYLQPRRKVGPDTSRVCNGTSRYDKGGVLGESDVVRKRSRGEEFRHNEVGGFGRNGEDLSDKKRNKLDVYDFDEYDGSDGIMMRRGHFDDVGMDGRRFFGSSMMSRSGAEREYEMGSSRHAVADGRKNSYFERTSGLSRGDLYDRDGARRPISFLRDNHDSDGPIRVQGKNGVLKVMVNKKKKIGGSSNIYDRLEAEGRKDLRTEDIVKRNAPIRPAYYSEPKVVEKASSFVGTEKNPMNLLKSSSTKSSKRRHHDPDDSDTSLKLGIKSAEAYNNMKTPVSTKNSLGQDMSSEDSDTSLKLGRKDVEVRKSMKGMGGAGEITPSNELLDPKLKGGKVKRGSGTEKQKLRERIRGMLLANGWTIDYRPRRNRDYLDAVYINPSGTAYWSIIKAYDALLKQLNDEEDEAAAKVDGSAFAPLSDEVLSQLTRKTRKKIEKEMKRKTRDGGESKNAKEAAMRKPTGIKHDDESMDSGSHEEKLSSYVKQGGKSLKSRINGDDSVSINSKGQSSAQNVHDVTEKPALGPSSHHGRKSKKLGRCTLLVRSSNEVFNSENDGFVPYSGKRTVLSWLIDSGTVQPSQKVRYMNRRRTKVMQEGWITREGIHCGCCSKILTVSKFEIHAASKLRQPFQNIYLDSGVSLLECQIDAWNRQDSIEHIGFHSVDTDGDDPNDDTCGLCGDGGDLICCDGCPSTFHQSCLDIKMLPPGEWHCPNCTCKFCRLASENFVEGDDTIVSTLHTCSLCLKKFHQRCMQEKDGLSSLASSLDSSFCGKKCRQLFDQLHKFLGVKHELEAGFSWSLIRRTDADLDATVQGLPQRIESNSKLAVALSVMDECFLPVVDRRSGVNLIRNVLYNCSSNFSRLNYSGFYTAILERGDEIISAASIRFHGTRLAEMPFIGTRHIYRRQGMCRRLFGAIESALCTLKVEKLIIPAISELTHTWTEIFGFTTLNESLKQELKSMNMLVFPGIDMLQKQLLGQENTDGKKAIATGIKLMESKDSQCVTPGLASKCKSNVDSSAEQDSPVCANDGPGHASETNEEAPTDNSDSQCLGVSLNDASVMSGSLDFCPERKSPVPLREKKNADSESGEKLYESALEKKGPCISDSSHEVREMDKKPQSDSPVEDNGQSHIQGDVGSSSRCPDASFDNGSDVSGCLDTSHELKNAISLQGGICVDSASTNKLAESAPCNNKDENGSELPSPGKDNPQSSTEGDVDDSSVMDPNEFASAEVKPSISLPGNTCADAPSEDKFGKLAAHDECPSNLHVTDVVEMETKPALNSISESRNHSCKECNLGDAGTIKVDMPSAEAPPSTLDTSTENSGEKIYEISGKFDDGDESSMQVVFAPHTEAACEKQSESDGASEGVPEATH